MSRAIKRLNWTRKKKTIRASEQSRIGEGTLLSLRKCPGSDLFAARIIDREHIDPLIQAFEQQVVQDWPSIGIPLTGKQQSQMVARLFVGLEEESGNRFVAGWDYSAGATDEFADRLCPR